MAIRRKRKRKAKAKARPVRAATPDRATIAAALATLDGASLVDAYRAGFAAGRRAQAEAEARARSIRASNRLSWSRPRRAEEEGYAPGQSSVDSHMCRKNILDYAKELVTENGPPIGGWNPNNVKNRVLSRVTNGHLAKPSDGYSDSTIKRVVAKRWPEIKKAAKLYRLPS